MSAWREYLAAAWAALRANPIEVFPQVSYSAKPATMAKHLAPAFLAGPTAAETSPGWVYAQDGSFRPLYDVFLRAIQATPWGQPGGALLAAGADPPQLVGFSGEKQAAADGSIASTVVLAAVTGKRWEVLSIHVEYIRSGGATETNAKVDETGGSNPLIFHGPRAGGPVYWRQATAATDVVITGAAGTATGNTWVAWRGIARQT